MFIFCITLIILPILYLITAKQKHIRVILLSKLLAILWLLAFILILINQNLFVATFLFLTLFLKWILAKKDLIKIIKLEVNRTYVYWFLEQIIPKKIQDYLKTEILIIKDDLLNFSHLWIIFKTPSPDAECDSPDAECDAPYDYEEEDMFDENDDSDEPSDENSDSDSNSKNLK